LLYREDFTLATSAIIIGIDSYAQQPLTSAVNDAQAFREILLELNLVDSNKVVMLTSPLGDSKEEATRKNITEALYELYAHGDEIDRMYFFFAGHGMLGFADAARGQSRTLLMTAEVKDLNRDGNYLISIDEIVDRMKLNGPQLIVADPIPGPIRIVTSVTKAPLSIHIDPDIAAPQTSVIVSQRRNILPQYSWPPHTNHETVNMEPQLYLLTAESTIGVPNPQSISVDLRKVNEATFKVSASLPKSATRAKAPESGPASATTNIDSSGSRESRGFAPQTLIPVTRVHAEAEELQAIIELDALEPPYTKWSQRKILDQEVNPGPYRISFRLGSDYFSQTSLYVRKGDAVEVVPSVAMTPLVQEALGEQGLALPRVTQISESIGYIQAAILPTMLPIIGIKPFDLNDEFFRRFNGAVEIFDIDTLGRCTLSVVVAVDGNRWPVQPQQVLSSVRCTLLASTTDERSSSKRRAELAIEANPFS
jgi:hypothetical protein